MSEAESEKTFESGVKLFLVIVRSFLLGAESEKERPVMYVSIDEIEMYPAELLTETLVPPVNVDKVYPPLSPIRSCPLAGVSVLPVPPYMTESGFVRVRVLLLRFVIEPKEEMRLEDEMV